MSHEIESIAWAGEVPWHGLGVEVDPNISAHEAMMQAGLNWKVEKVPLFYSKAGNPELCEVKGQVGIKRVDSQEILGVTTPAYVPFQNEEAFEVFQRVLDTGLAKFEAAGSLRGGKIVWALAHIQSDDLAVTGGDIVRPYVLLSAGHDAKRAIKAGFTPQRVICRNTLYAAESNDLSRLVRVAHKGAVKANVEALIDAMDLTVQEFRTTAEGYRRMLDTPINQEDLREYVRVTLGLVESTENKRATNVIDKVVGFANDGVGNDPVRGTVWAAYNGVTQWLSHVAGRNADNRFASLWFGNNKQVLQDAHANAMKRVA